MADEGQMLSPQEARLRRAARKSKVGDQPKVKLDLVTESKEYTKNKYNRYYIGRVTSGTKRDPVQRQVLSRFRYMPQEKRIVVDEMMSERLKTNEVDPIGRRYSDLHHEFKHKMMPSHVAKKAIEKLSLQFPKAEVLTGERVTGAHHKALMKASDEYILPHEEIKKIANQRFNLKRLRERLSKAGKAGKILGVGLAAYEAYKDWKGE